MFFNPKLLSKVELQCRTPKQLDRIARELQYRRKGIRSALPLELHEVMEAQRHIIKNGLTNFNTTISKKRLLERAITLFPSHPDTINFERNYE